MNDKEYFHDLSCDECYWSDSTENVDEFSTCRGCHQGFMKLNKLGIKIDALVLATMELYQDAIDNQSKVHNKYRLKHEFMTVKQLQIDDFVNYIIKITEIAKE